MRTTALAALVLVSACSADDLQTATNSEGLSVSAIPRGSVWKYWDAGTDLGTAWRGDFDDASWSTGAGPLGFGETYVATTVKKGPITTYFRRTFTIDDPAAVTAMAAELMYDDGVVVYLNGLEIGREAMPAGTITATTQSSGHEANNTYLSFDWTHHVDVLRAGTNVLAVEVHQAGTASSDLVFDLSLTLETDEAPPPSSGDDIARGSSWWYRDDGADLGGAWRGLQGAQPSWSSGAGPLGFGESYIRTSTAPGRMTTYFRREITVDDPAAVSAITGELMYDDGAVVYLNGHEIARVAMPGGTITASTPSTGHEANNAYQTFDWTGSSHRLQPGVNVIAVEVHQTGTTSSDLVFDLALDIETTQAPPPTEELGGFGRRADWWYWDFGGEPEPGWRNSWYVSGWKAGFGPFGYGETYLQTVIDHGTDPSNKHVTSYFKEYFNLYNPSAATQMIAEIMYDDGVVVYLNGTEILRAGMPSGPITSTTLALGHEAENAYVTFDVSAYRHLLHQGFNWIDVEVHQQSPSSSDLVFDMGFRVLGEQAPPPSAEEDIARGSVWAYWDRVETPSEYDVWKDNDYNDAQWGRGAGPLGYGDSHLRTTISYGPDPANKTITAYFRRTFTVDAPSVETRMLLELMYDDGVVVYLNGAEIVRRGMGTHWDINHDTLAVASHEGTTYELIDISNVVGNLRRGTNLLAVEVHQHTPSSSDLAFDASLQIDTPAVCAIPGGGAAVPPLPAHSVNDVWVAPGAVYATVGDTIGRRNSDGEWCWARPVPDQGWGALWGAADDDVWFVGPAGKVMHYDGASFAIVDVGATEDLHGVWGSGPDDIWIVGRRGTVRHFDGTAWAAHDLLDNQTLYTVWGLSRDDVWIGGTEPAPYPGNPNYDGSSGLVFRWAPGTGTWDLVFKNTMYYGGSAIWGLDGTSPDDVWAIGSDHPAGAACSIEAVWRFDGTTWNGMSGDHTECANLYDIDAGAPGATDGAWIVGWWEDSDRGAWRYTGGAWSEFVAPQVTTTIDHRGDRMFAGGWSYEPRRGHFLLRWDGTAFVQEW
jgi:hypothetical protein